MAKGEITESYLALHSHWGKVGIQKSMKYFIP